MSVKSTRLVCVFWRYWPHWCRDIRDNSLTGNPEKARRLIDKLELLLALAKERHFGRAAEACGVTQPTMSTSLKQLEEILGVMLVQRGSRFQGFTPEGERALDWARRIVGDTRAMRQEINSTQGQAFRRNRDRGDPHRARHGRLADDAVSRAASGRAFPHRVLHLGPTCSACWKISRSMPG